MKKGIFAKFIGQSFRGILYRAVCILFALTVLSSWAVSGVYAKYVDATTVDESAGVARLGVVTFELLEHKAKDISDDLDKALETDMLYELLTEQDPLKPGEKNEYKTVIPGTDIPKDPFINLMLANNEVSYELYVEVKKSDSFPKDVAYQVTDDWEEFKTKEDGSVVYRFKRNDEGNNIVNGVFLAGAPHTFQFDADKGKDTSIHILYKDRIKVSQYFNSELNEKGEPTKFSLTFTAYLQQAITIPPDSTDGTTEGND